MLESLTNFGSFFPFKAKISYTYISIPSNHCFQVNFKEFYMFFQLKLLELLLFYNMKSNNAVK